LAWRSTNAYPKSRCQRLLCPCARPCRVSANFFCSPTACEGRPHPLPSAARLLSLRSLARPPHWPPPDPHRTPSDPPAALLRNPRVYRPRMWRETRVGPRSVLRGWFAGVCPVVCVRGALAVREGMLVAARSQEAPEREPGRPAPCGLALFFSRAKMATGRGSAARAGPGPRKKKAFPTVSLASCCRRFFGSTFCLGPKIQNVQATPNRSASERVNNPGKTQCF